MTNEIKNQIFKLRREGKSYTEIADLTGVSIGSVKSIISRHSREISQGSYCKECGTEIKLTEGKKKKEFCSAACRKKHWKAHHFKEVTCKVCGTKFKVDDSSKQIYCSHKCYITDRYGKVVDSND